MSDLPAQFPWTPPGSAKANPPFGKTQTGFVADDPVYSEWLNAKWANDHEWKEYLAAQARTFSTVADAIDGIDPGSVCIVAAEDHAPWSDVWLDPNENIVAAATDGRTVCTIADTGANTAIYFYNAADNSQYFSASGMGPVENASVATDGNIFVTACGDQALFFDAESRSQIAYVDLPNTVACRPGFFRGEVVIACESESVVYIYNTAGISAGVLRLPASHYLHPGEGMVAMASDGDYFYAIYVDDDGNKFLGVWSDLREEPVAQVQYNYLPDPQPAKDALISDGVRVYVGFEDAPSEDMIKCYSVVNKSLFGEEQALNFRMIFETSSIENATGVEGNVTGLAVDRDYLYATVRDYMGNGTMLIVFDKALKFVRMFTVAETSTYLFNPFTDGLDLWLITSDAPSGSHHYLRRTRTDSTVAMWRRKDGGDRNGTPIPTLLAPLS